MCARVPISNLRYWRDKQGHETDFIWQPRSKAVTAIECKWSARDFNPTNFQIFAKSYPKATLIAVATDAKPAFTRENGGVKVEFITLDTLIERITSK